MTDPNNDDAPQRLASRGLSALKWNYAGVAVRTVCQLAIGVVLARMLGPGPFGVVAVAWLVISACNLIADFGLGAVLVQRPRLEPRDVHFVFSCQLGIGAAMTLIGLLLSDRIAAFFQLSQQVLPIQAMFSLFLLQSLGQTSAALLRRALDFRYVQQVSILSYLVGYLVFGIPLAGLGFGVWALVVANLVQVLGCSVGYVLRTRRQLGWALRPASDGTFSFGGKVVLANLSSWSIANLDSLAVGRVLGPVELGLYNRAMTLVSSPMGAFVSGLQGVLFAACSRAQDRPDLVRSAYLGATTAVGLVSMPLFCSIAAVAPTVVVGLYGEQWRAATVPLTALALAMPLMALLALAGPVLMSMDRVSKEVKAQVITIVVMAPLLYLAAHHSMDAVAWAKLLVYALRWALLTRAVLRMLEVPARRVFSAVFLPTLLAVATATAAWAADRGLEALGAVASVRLALIPIAAAAALLLGLSLAGPALMDGELGRFLRARGRLPALVSKLLRVRDP